MRILNESIDYKEYLEIKKGVIYDEELNSTFERYSVDRPLGVGALVFNKDLEQFILIKQFRYPVFRDINRNILEIPAGVVEEGDSELTTLRREMIEEIGYDIDINKATKIGTYYMSVGMTNDRISLYLCEVTNDDIVSNGGGLDSENENIKIYHFTKQNLIDMIKKGEIVDGKTAMCITYYLSKIYEDEKSNNAIMGRISL